MLRGALLGASGEYGVLDSTPSSMPSIFGEAPAGVGDRASTDLRFQALETVCQFDGPTGAGDGGMGWWLMMGESDNPDPWWLEMGAGK
jgi:hypothetical protein